MKSTEGLNISVVTMGNPIIDKRVPCDLRPMNLEKVCQIIDGRVQDRRVREEVKKAAGSYPQGSLGNFVRNLRMYIERAQKTVALTPIQHRGELGDEQEEVNDLGSVRDSMPDEFN